ENREKRERAELKLNEQKERQTKITEEIGLLELKLDATVIVRDKMKRYVNDYKKNVVSRIKSTAADKNLELTQIKLSCWNLYQQICKRKGIPLEFSKDDIENQLVYTKRTITELKRIVKVAKKQAMKEKKSTRRLSVI
ncbi:hypothetical protein PV328_012324, partial [Microctonus aethiopoides]